MSERHNPKTKTYTVMIILLVVTVLGLSMIAAPEVWMYKLIFEFELIGTTIPVEIARNISVITGIILMSLTLGSFVLTRQWFRKRLTEIDLAQRDGFKGGLIGTGIALGLTLTGGILIGWIITTGIDATLIWIPLLIWISGSAIGMYSGWYFGQ